ncbi:meiotic nuclear division protein 1 [Blastocladiella britannica]|nr:meiotic nuclear division protein 1 [Blastocladiella britannica]
MAKGVSADEKRKRVLDLFHETKDVYTLKDVEKAAAKRGVVQNAVKDVVQGLVDDGLVMCEKIGSSNYFWSFPSTAFKAQSALLTDLRGKAARLQKEHDQLAAALKEAQDVRQETEERAVLMAELEQFQSEAAAMAAELDQYKDCDPEVHALTLAQVQQARDGVNRWTDNLMMLESYVVKLGFERKMFYKEFGIPEEIDSV